MQQRTKCNINWQIEGPETPKRILVAKREGGKEGRVVSQTVFGGTEMMPRHHQLKGREREGEKILRWHKWCCLYLGLLRPNSTSSVYSTNANHVARERERGKGAAGKEWGGNERRQLLCLLFIQIFWCVYLACERKGKGRLKGNLVWIDICCLVCWAFAALHSLSFSLPPLHSPTVCLSVWFNKLAREFSILLDFLLPFRLMFNMFYNVP